MIRRLALAAVLVGFPLASVQAQQPAAVAGTTRCGGLLCDLYYSNKPAPTPGQPEAPDPTHLPCRDFLCAAFGGRTPDAAPPPPEPVAAPVAPAPAKSARHKAKARKTAAPVEASAGK